jgi:multicomponent Na+:H+ antiporter subunit G
MTIVVLDILTVAALLFGLFFLFIGALGLWRLPDVFNRMHAASKCLTLGISGTLLAAVLHLATLDDPSHPLGDGGIAWSTVAAAGGKAILVIIFQYTAAPVGAHMLARAAHIDGAAKWEGTIDDELQTDRDRKPGGQADAPLSGRAHEG